MFVRDLKCKRCKKMFKHFTNNSDPNRRPDHCEDCKRLIINERYHNKKHNGNKERNGNV